MSKYGYKMTAANRRHAQKAAKTMKAYSSRVASSDKEGYEIWMVDLVADLMHLAAQRGISFPQVTNYAMTHFTAEARGEA